MLSSNVYGISAIVRIKTNLILLNGVNTKRTLYETLRTFKGQCVILGLFGLKKRRTVISCFLLCNPLVEEVVLISDPLLSLMKCLLNFPKCFNFYDHNAIHTSKFNPFDTDITYINIALCSY